jgi:hypothetical protein
MPLPNTACTHHAKGKAWGEAAGRAATSAVVGARWRRSPAAGRYLALQPAWACSHSACENPCSRWVNCAAIFKVFHGHQAIQPSQMAPGSTSYLTRLEIAPLISVHECYPMSSIPRYVISCCWVALSVCWQHFFRSPPWLVSRCLVMLCLLVCVPCLLLELNLVMHNAGWKGVTRLLTVGASWG